MGPRRGVPYWLAESDIDSRWALKWKQSDGEGQIERLLTLDKQGADIAVFSCAMSWSGRRAGGVVGPQRKWQLLLADIGEACIRSLIFGPAAVIRQAQLALLPDSAPISRLLDNDVDVNLEVNVTLMLRCDCDSKADARPCQNALKQAPLEINASRLIGELSSTGIAITFFSEILPACACDVEGGEDASREKVPAFLELEPCRFKKSRSKRERMGAMIKRRLRLSRSGRTCSTA